MQNEKKTKPNFCDNIKTAFRWQDLHGWKHQKAKKSENFKNVWQSILNTTIKMTQQLSFQDKVNIGCNDDNYNTVMFMTIKNT